ncbi:MAG: hypothetical protein ACYS32_03085 [Planctomycetota bacterium]|jgi:hypothetical protein
MINQSNKLICLVLLSVFLLTGCEQQQIKDLQQTHIPSQVPSYSTQAIEVTGGLDNWTNTKKVEFDCIATFYQLDGSFYLTKQHHEIFPWSNSIRVSAQEPQGKFIWEYSPGGLNLISGTMEGIFLPVGLDAEDFTKAILDITTTPVRLINNKAGLTKGTNPVKIEGRWYYPIGQVESNNESNIIYYQNRDSSLVDMIWFTCAERGTPLAVRGYDYHEIEKGSVFLPAKIEIFMTDLQGSIQNRLATIDYH